MVFCGSADRSEMTMLFLVICLLPLRASASNCSTSIFYDGSGKISNINIVGDKKNCTILDLSASLINFRPNDNIFRNVMHVESLLLDNSSLTSLPDFTNLTRLKTLSLANNKISQLRPNLFADLKNLQLLNLSSNPINRFGTGDLFGLIKSVKILTDRNILSSISATAFSKNFFYSNFFRNYTAMQLAEMQDTKITTKIQKRGITKHYFKLYIHDYVLLCKSNGTVTGMVLQYPNEIGKGCIDVPLPHDRMNGIKWHMILPNRGIKGFQRNWYQLKNSFNVASLDLSNNKITEITQETLNNLPMNVTHVNLAGNKIRRICNQVIENHDLRNLNLRGNLIEEIEEDAFISTNLSTLYLTDNKLKSLNFVSSLSDSLTVFKADRNNITTISESAFVMFNRLNYLELQENEIQALQNYAFLGLGSLLTLTLAGNSIKTIGPRAFAGLTSLQTLNLSHNSISDLQKGTFAHLISLQHLDLTNNKIAKAIAFSDLARSVISLSLAYNEIDILEEGNFVQAPKLSLSLTGNRISRIMRGAFLLPTLEDLHLGNNNLTTIEGDSFEGLNGLKRLWLSENKISEIHKGACKNLGNIYILNISKNPLQKLENGALHGLNIFGYVLISDNNLKEIHGGVFDDV